MSDTTLSPQQLESLERDIWRALADVPDPEIPPLSVVDLGIIRYVHPTDEHRAIIGVSPTYTGCPATEVIHRSIREHLRSTGIEAEVRSVLSPAWSSDWISESGRAKLREYGIAPPMRSVSSLKTLLGMPSIQCPQCGSRRTQRISEYGSTPCKALHRCDACLEPFEYFKCI